MEFSHKSVLLNEVLDNLVTDKNGIYVDGTLGGAGHTLNLLKRLENGTVIGIDRDEEALSAAHKRLEDNGYSIRLVHDNFSNINKVLDDAGIDKITGAMLDLGLSSYQIDNPERGFAYMTDAPLDMRMDREQYLSAYNIVNEYSEWELYRLIQDYGEENWAKRIAQFIVDYRERNKIETTGQLVDIINAAIPAAARRSGGHPAKRTFQAIRIEVNGELKILENAVKDFAQRLESGGRLCIITFHSLEDRIVKRAFKELENPCTCPVEAPRCVCGKKPTVKLITRKPILPSEEECKQNSRAQSAKLRVLEKL